MPDDFDKNKINSLIIKNFGKPPTKLSLIASGEISTAYSFGIDTKKYVLRLADRNNGFINDSFIAKNFSSPQLFIPATLFLGQLDNKYYSITQKCSGRLIENLDYNHRLNLLANFIKITHLFHSLPLESNVGFGPINMQGNGSFLSWSEYLLSQTPVASELWPSGYFYKLQRQISNKLTILPSLRSLIHGDYGFNNVFAQRGKISGVIDWSDVKYGDFVYDIAYLSFWSKSLDYSKLFFNYYLSQKTLNLNHYFTRFQIYTIHLGIDLLNYFAKTSQPNSFIFVKNKLDDFLFQYTI